MRAEGHPAMSAAMRDAPEVHASLTDGLLALSPAVADVRVALADGRPALPSTAVRARGLAKATVIQPTLESSSRLASAAATRTPLERFVAACERRDLRKNLERVATASG